MSGIFLKGGGVFSSAGYIKCKSCNWGQNGNSAPMLSFNDLERMVNERLRKYNQ